MGTGQDERGTRHQDELRDAVDELQQEDSGDRQQPETAPSAPGPGEPGSAPGSGSAADDQDAEAPAMGTLDDPAGRSDDL